MQEEKNIPEDNIELHHQSIEEIMGTPPAKSIAAGSGIILVILMALLGGSAFVYTSDIMKAGAVIYGKEPLAVLTAPESGQIVAEEGYDFSQREAERGETLLHIRNTAGDLIPVTAISAGIAEINPLAVIRKNVRSNDTVGYIWSTEPVTFASVISLSRAEAGKIQPGNKIRLYLEPDNLNSIIETEVKEKFETLAGNRIQIISVLAEKDLTGKDIRGTVEVPADIVTGKKSLFNRMVNPFRGMERR